MAYLMTVNKPFVFVSLSLLSLSLSLSCTHTHTHTHTHTYTHKSFHMTGKVLGQANVIPLKVSSIPLNRPYPSGLRECPYVLPTRIWLRTWRALSKCINLIYFVIKFSSILHFDVMSFLGIDDV